MTKPIICIDAGHGASTAGKRSPDGTYLEHEFNLDVANRLAVHLRRCNCNVILTRWDDEDPTLARRCAICNDSGAVLLISIHTNAAGNKGWYDAEGWQAYVYKLGYEATKLAEAIRRHAIPMLGCADRGVVEDNLAMVRDTNCPAVIVEHGFHTNKREVEKLKTSAYRELCAESDARGICDYLSIPFIPAPIVVDDTPSWAKKAKQTLMDIGVTDGTRPNEPATRAEVWVMLERLNQYIQHTKVL